MKEYRYRPREIRRLIESVEVDSCADGSLIVTPKWKPPAGGIMTRLRVANWMFDLINDKLAVKSVDQSAAAGRRGHE